VSSTIEDPEAGISAARDPHAEYHYALLRRRASEENKRAGARWVMIELRPGIN